MAENYQLRCACGARETVTVEQFTELYAAMNEKRWGLIPTQHGYIVKGVCPDCRLAADQARNESQ